jgi:hypothetical protein
MAAFPEMKILIVDVHKWLDCVSGSHGVRRGVYSFAALRLGVGSGRLA